MFNDNGVADIKIETFQLDYQQEIIDLILNIQQKEFGIAITAQDQPDLKSIADVYQTGDGNFWVAIVGDQIVGTVALIDIGHKSCALRKMFVHSEYRGAKFQVAHKLLETLIDWCREHGVMQIWLGTISKYLVAHRFYEKNGFVEVSKGDLPSSFPVMKVDTKFYTRSIGVG